MSTVGRRRKLLGGFLLTLLLLYLGASWYVLKVTVTPRRILNTITPDQLGLPQTESFVFNNLDDGVRLQGWLVPSEGHRVVILIHGVHSQDLSESLPERVIDQISPRPILLIHGTDDTVVPFEQARRLQASGGPNIQLWPLAGYGHAEGIRLEPGYPKWSPMREHYLRRVREFFLANL